MFVGSNLAEEILMEIKIRSMTSFGGEVKPSITCRKILWHVKEPCRYEKRYFMGKNSRPFFARFLLLCY
jgi:hypothetical protein